LNTVNAFSPLREKASNPGGIFTCCVPCQERGQREKDWNHDGDISQRAQRECQFMVRLRERWHGSSLCLMPSSNQNPQLIRITLVIVPRELHWNGLGK